MNELKLLNTTFKLSKTMNLLSVIASVATVLSTIYVAFSFIKSFK